MGPDRLVLEPAPWAPLGATPGPQGLGFALWAPHATRVELCLFDDEGVHEWARAEMPAHRHGVWHGCWAAGRAGQVYGYRVHGPWEPSHGHRFNPHKVLLDPYAREVVGEFLAQPEFCGHDASQPARMSRVDNAALALKARALPPLPAASRRAAPVPDGEVVLYEVHVKAATQRLADLPEALRGTYAGLGHPAAIAHFKRLGVSTLSLLPVHHRIDETRLLGLGLSNHWGYNTVAFFAPERRYWSAQPGSTPWSEFRAMVDALHAADLEVVLDVVFNHTGETDELGPTLSFRGIDNAAYYHLKPEDPSLYENWTGCGNALKLSEPRVTQLVIDALRLWVEAGGVDGFRFDLAPTLARDARGFAQSAGFFAALQADPVLRGVRLIAEPWDIGPGGYQLGHFPAGWQEWNDHYRDTVRGFWLQGHATRGSFAHALAGSARHFHRPGRDALSSVNFLTAHDGFTLRDLVSYDQRHNEANGEGNRDGHAHNLSWNCGVEGESDDASVRDTRARLQRALLATLMVSQGTPMLLAGDEIGHSQHGNNNAYCQDNATTWLDWPGADAALLEEASAWLALRRAHPLLRSPTWWRETHQVGPTIEAAWWHPSGQPLASADWGDSHQRAMALTLRDGPSQAPLCLIFNPQAQACDFSLPPGAWASCLCSTAALGDPGELGPVPGTARVPARAVWVLSGTASAARAAAPPSH